MSVGATGRSTASRRPAGGGVIVLGPHLDARGGISAVLRTHSQMPFWKVYRCHLVPTVGLQRSIGARALAVLRALVSLVVAMPSARLVHIHTASRRSFYRKSPFVAMAYLWGKPVVLHVHGPAFPLFFRSSIGPLRWYIRWILSLAKAVVAVSTANARELQRCFPNIEMQTVPNPYEPLPVTMERSGTPPTILFAGRIDPEKGLLDLIHAFAEVMRRISDVRLIVAGDGVQAAEAMQLAKTLGIVHAVDFRGWVAGPELAASFASASVFCLPSYCDAMPMALLAAMAARISVVATPVGGIPELIQSEINGLLVSPGDVEALSGALVRMLTDPALRERLSACAFDRAQLNSPSHVNDLVCCLYASILPD